MNTLRLPLTPSNVVVFIFMILFFQDGITTCSIDFYHRRVTPNCDTFNHIFLIAQEFFLFTIKFERETILPFVVPACISIVPTTGLLL